MDGVRFRLALTAVKVLAPPLLGAAGSLFAIYWSEGFAAFCHGSAVGLKVIA